MTMFKIIPIELFRDTPDVLFYDATIPNTVGCDVVTHGPRAISPPNDDEYLQFYIHHNQVDHNLCVHGVRIFELVNKLWKYPYHRIFLNPKLGSLRIPIGTYHRSVSGVDGSVLINQSFRTNSFDFNTEFIPVSTRNDEELHRIVTTIDPILHNF